MSLPSQRKAAKSSGDSAVGTPLPGARFEHDWRARFDEFAKLRDDDAGIAGWSRTGLDARIRRFVRLWQSAAPGLWLDAGCGAGTYTRILLGNGHAVAGVDYSLNTLRKTVSRGLAGASFTVADIRSLPFGSEQFDGILCFGVTQALTESEHALEELARSLRPGGQLWIDGLNGWCVVHLYERLRRKLTARPPHLRYEFPQRLIRLARRCGIENIRLHWMPIAPATVQSAQQIFESPPMDWFFRYVPAVGACLSHAFILYGSKSIAK